MASAVKPGVVPMYNIAVKADGAALGDCEWRQLWRVTGGSNAGCCRGLQAYCYLVDM